MPQTSSAKKEMRASRRRQQENKSVRSRCKSRVTKAEGLILSGEVEAGREAVMEAIKTLDKAAEKGVIHANNAARRKSRLMKKLNRTQAKPSETA
ncbi:MAG: 30S ribosomal protein S20 [Dehalococcoidales bacterium]|nr:30S ribosomal protein S20 [Dehalococcoidales bacterium]